jgi:hypothetical protein
LSHPKLRQQENRLDRFQDLADVKRCISSTLAAGKNIRDVFPRTALGDNTRPQIIAATPQLADFDFRIGLRKRLNRFFGQWSGVENVNAKQSFFFGGCNRSLPLGFPGWFRLRGKSDGVG